MKYLIKNLFNFLNPDSERNIDRSINYLKNFAEENNLITSEVSELESFINNTTDSKSKFSAKKNLRNKLKSIYQDFNYKSLEDSIDKAW